MRLENGLRFVALRRTVVPLVRLRLLFLAGAEQDPPGQEGLASLVTPLVRAGSHGFDASALERTTNHLGADLVTAVDWETGSLTIDVLPEDVDRALTLLVDLARAPVFPVSALDSMRQRRRTQLRDRRFQPPILATDWFSRVLYGDVGYGISLFGTISGLDTVTAADVAEFHRMNVRLSRASLIAVGCIDVDALRQRLERLDLSQDADAPATPAPPVRGTPPARRQPEVCIVDVPQATSTELRIGHVGVAYDHPDRPTIELLNALLGGSFVSRLHRRLREREGLTYSLHSRFVARRRAGPFLISLCVPTGRVAAAVREICREIDDLRCRCASADEHRAAQRSLATTDLHACTVYADLTDRLSWLETFDGSDDYYARWFRKMACAAPSDIYTVAGRHLHPNTFAIVAAGPATALRLPLAEFGVVTEVGVTDLDGQRRWT